MELLLVDPSPIFRTGLKTLVAEAPETDRLEVIAECGDCTSGAGLAAKLAPDLVVSDLHLGDRNGIELVRDLARTAPAVRVLILASYAPESIVHQAVVAGAAGYVLKQQSPLVVLSAIKAAGRGELVLPPGISEPRRQPARSDRGPEGIERLSRREREVFDLAVWGSSNKQIAGRLGISTKTVETHRGHINRKLRVHTSADLVRLASLLGLLVPAPAQGGRTGSNGVQA